MNSFDEEDYSQFSEFRSGAFVDIPGLFSSCNGCNQCVMCLRSTCGPSKYVVILADTTEHVFYQLFFALNFMDLNPGSTFRREDL